MGKPVQNTQLVDFLKIVLTLGIVLRHATPAQIPSDGSVVSTVLRGIVLLTEVCVPLFFVLSGFLFFLNVPEDPASSWFGKKLGRRVHSLLIPYLVANLFAWACYAAAYRWYPGIMGGFLGENWKDPLYALWNGPINMSLWFIRELIKVSLLAPVVYLLVRYTRWWGVLALGVLGFLNQIPLPWFYFSLGAMTAYDSRTRGWVCGVRMNVSPAWRGWCYFVYLYHYVPIITVKKLAYGYSSAAWAQALAYLLVVVLILGALSLVWALLRRYMPRVLGVLIGGK